MPSGLVALFDDVAGIAKLAAASIDDIGAAAGKAGSKAVGVVIDDTAVTPRYVTGLSPARELPIIAKIARGSLFNKLVILLPACLAITAFAPWALTPLLMVGGAYLCFEGAEKVIESFSGPHETAVEEVAGDPAALEDQKVASAVRTDFILSAEIMAIALGEVADSPLVSQAIILAVVAVAITAGVYGLVAAIVKADDVGLHLAEGSSAPLAAFGRGLVKAMPPILAALGVVGTAAMIWVGGQIVIHGLAHFGIAAPEHLLHEASVAVGDIVPAIRGALEWIVGAAGAGVFGLALGSLVAGLIHLLPKRGKAAH